MIIANWSCRRLHVHRRRRRWLNKLWENVILCCRRFLGGAHHDLCFFTRIVISNNTLFLSRYHCYKINKDSHDLSISYFLNFCYISFRKKLRSIFKFKRDHRRTDTQRYLSSHGREYLFHEETYTYRYIHFSMSKDAHRDAHRYKRIHTQINTYFCISYVYDYSLFSYLWLRIWSVKSVCLLRRIFE